MTVVVKTVYLLRKERGNGTKIGPRLKKETNGLYFPRKVSLK